ncbi:MAG: hypothetical protein RR342_01280 [Bacilli bacterium]
MNDLKYNAKTNSLIITDKILNWRAQKITRKLCKKLKLEGDFQVDVIITLRVYKKYDRKA